ncbi:hypothetical protein [Spiroplasma endosymbiont of Aspidapion aeneum]|uniref:hypothetical protein n=1 Tax=Spiroplasma endosymbiont of Aspidapion aeneum TaxID=3066276 RepID=UPI00313D32DD
MFKIKNKMLVIINWTLINDWIIILVFFAVVMGVMFQIFTIVYSTHEGNGTLFEKIHFQEVYYIDKSLGSNKHYFLGVNNIIYFLLSGPLLVYLLFYFMLSFSIHFYLESYSKKMTIWLTTPMSRNRLFFSKMICIYIEMLIIITPVILFTFILLFRNENLNTTDYFNYFVQLISFLISVIMFTSAYALAYLYLYQKIKIANFTFFFVTLFIIFIYAIDKIIYYHLVEGFAAKFFFYIDIVNLMGNQFDNVRTDQWNIYQKQPQYLLMCTHAKHNYIKASIFIVVSIVVTSFLSFLNIKKFNKIDFNV